MAGTSKKRPQDEVSKSKPSRPSKKQKKLAAYHSDSDEATDNGGDFDAVNLLDSDNEDLDDIEVDDVASDEDNGSESPSDSEEDNHKARGKKKSQPSQKQTFAKDAPDSEDDSPRETDDDSDSDGDGRLHRKRSKRNDPTAFATSLSKILSTKLSTSRRADPVLARSAEAQQASRQALDAALETKARRRMRDAKRLAMEKGRVRDVLIAGSGSKKQLNVVTGEVEVVEDESAETTAQILETERRLRKVAQRGVVKLFNAVRAAQVKASEAERVARNEGVVGVKRREEKVTEMSRKGFLDLIASGGGKLKGGGLEEA